MQMMGVMDQVMHSINTDKLEERKLWKFVFHFFFFTLTIKLSSIAEIFKNRFENQSGFKKFIKIFRPFVFNTRDLYVGDVFFFPQRFFAATLLAYITLIYAIVNSFSIIDAVSDA
jgi:hypothetical protein